MKKFQYDKGQSKGEWHTVSRTGDDNLRFQQQASLHNQALRSMLYGFS